MLTEKTYCHHAVDVYYDAPMDNYYCVTCSKGMGVLYYRLAKQYEALKRQYEPLIRQNIGDSNDKEKTKNN